MKWSEGDVTVGGGIRLHYYRAGAGAPVVLAHGATDNGRCWDRLAEVLASDYDVVAYDARSHGKSDAPPDGPIAGGEDLVAVAEQLELARPAIIGHSMGARTVAQAAVLRPDLFRCAVLEDPPWWEAPPDITRRPQFDYASMSVEEIAIEGRAQNPTWHPDEFAAWAQSKKQFRPTPDWMKGVPGMGSGWRELAAGLSIPTLLICGEAALGAIVSQPVADEVRTLSPAIEAIALDAGHSVRREAFDGYVEAVTTFLARNA